MPFSVYLKQKLIANRLSQARLAESLSVFHSALRAVDHITISRWVNNHTTPSLYRQFLVCLFFKDDVFHYIYYVISSQVEPSQVFNKLKHSVFDLSRTDKKINSVWSLAHDSSWRYHTMNHAAFLETIGEFRRLASSVPEGTHYQVVYHKSHLSSYVTSFFSLTQLDNQTVFGCTSGPSFFSNLILCYSCSDFDFLNYVLALLFIQHDSLLLPFQFLVSDTGLLNLYTELGAKQIASYYINELNVHVYVLQIEVIRFLSNAYITNLLLHPQDLSSFQGTFPFTHPYRLKETLCCL
ncbi:hypothetical protein [Photobacterium damselae]|uniref:hypothetical protein n=1 Tax=Photobacterium damselae TaxID=38293 RepID=UPI001EFC3A08|nr:hypothetical protein [Photobacterium damselae]MCG9780709.1 hypothetical protein [Photobacterium damselae]